MSAHPSSPSLFDARPELSPLPVPTRARFQPLRLGLVELFHYDVEEFWFRDGHLLLRGNNGTGKSKVLSLTLPFLLDASLSPTRVEPDGDRTKRMEWNLLMGRHERRVGYSWLELGRLDDAGVPQYVTLGCGMRAVHGRPRVESWHFITELRVGEGLALVTPERTALSKERLGEALSGHGQLYDTAREYRRAVDARLFRLGDRYDALIDTLIQLRQPQLSKKPDEASLSDALSNAMPELPRGVLEDVAEAMNQLETYREELEHLDRVRGAVAQFGRRYRAYAQVQSRRRARALRKAQTEVDKQSQIVNEARAELARATESRRLHEGRVAELGATSRAERATLDELLRDPTMSDAHRLRDLEAAVQAATRERDKASRREREAAERLAQEQAEHARRTEQLEELERGVTESDARSRQAALEAGIDKAHADAADALPPSEPSAIVSLERELLALEQRRRAQIAQVRRRLLALDEEERARQKSEARCQLYRERTEEAEREARRSHKELERACAGLLEAWRAYTRGLSVLRLEDVESGLSELEAWVESIGFEQPMRLRLEAAQRVSETELAERQSQIQQERRALEQDDAALEAELTALRAGKQRVPEPPTTRDPGVREGREGAPFFRLLEFREHVPPSARAGLEAALEGAGLLDAWVTKEGCVLHPDTHDTWLEPGPAQPSSLLAWLSPGDGAVEGTRIEALLASVACADEDDDPEAHTFVSPSGRFRVGSLRGASRKAEPHYVGQAAREAERQRRIAWLEARRLELSEALHGLAQRGEELVTRRDTLKRELLGAPKEDAVLGAHAAHAELERQRQRALEALASVEVELQKHEQRVRAARDELTRDAHDLKLPVEPATLSTLEATLSRYASEVRMLRKALEAAMRARDELTRQIERQRSAHEHAAECTREASARGLELEDVEARYRLLRETAGAAVAELTRKVSAVRTALEESERALEHERVLVARTSAEEARLDQRAKDGQVTLDERAGQRKLAVQQLSAFAATGLLVLALPELELPSGDAWAVDPALTLARQIEQRLHHVAAEDDDWTRIQNDVSRDYTTLGQALSSLGQKAQMEQSDFGLLVHILYQNRPERPDVLETLLSAEIEQRRTILSAREREVLENHLQAEVAAGLQRLVRDAEAQVERMNQELKRRPTSTGVYFRLDWEPLLEATDGSLTELAAVRTRLLRRVSDAWSSEDRRVVGEFLTARINAERKRDDSGPLVDHLARALDYRSWHRFRVKRWHDGAFRPLSGPASSGERALGLTVPLFAAASSHYASAGSPHAPRLVLLDEAFAGIDDEARAHCMALIREFDLDFVMTSEREWGCYATLPGVSICHILRREGIDAAFVSRWTWDGRARRAETDPTRRFTEGVRDGV